MPANKRRQLVDIPWRWHHLSAPFSTGLVIYLAGLLLSYGLPAVGHPVPWLAVLLIGVVATIAAWVGPVASLDARTVGAYAAICTAAAMIWLTLAAVFPVEMIAAIVLAVGTVFAAGFYPKVRVDFTRARKEPQHGTAAELVRAPKNVFLLALHKVGITDVELDPVEGEQTTMAGVRCVFELPEKGTTLAQIKNKAEQIEGALGRIFRANRDVKVRRGCVHIEPHEDPWKVIVHFDFNDILAQPMPIELDHSPASINDPFVVGRWMNDSPITVLFRELHMLIISMSGGGKSNLINVMLAYFTRCKDVVLWVSACDKFTPLVHPWLTPWLRHGHDRKTPPIFDWCADSIYETAQMLLAAYRVVDMRQKKGRGRKTKIIPSQETPQLIVIIEEASAALCHNEKFRAHTGEKLTISDLVKRLTKLGRSEAVAVIVMSQRGTREYLGPQGPSLKSQMGITFAMKMEKKADGGFVVDDKIDLSKIDNPGNLYAKIDKERPLLPGRALFLDDEGDLVVEIAEAHTKYVGELEPYIRSGLGRVYAERWDPARTAEWLPAMLEDEDALRDEDSPVTVGGMPDNVEPVDNSGEAARPETKRRDSRLARPRLSPETQAKADAWKEKERLSTERMFSQLDEILQGAVPTAPSGEPTVPPFREPDQPEEPPVSQTQQLTTRQAIHQLLYEAGQQGNGMETGEIKKALLGLGITVSSKTVQEQLDNLVTKDKAVVRVDRGFYRHVDFRNG